MDGYIGIISGGFSLAYFIDGYQKNGESLNIVAHSDGGNVAKIASWFIIHSITNLVNLGTPENWDLPDINRGAVNNYCNVSSLEDPVQFAGASPYRIENTAVNAYYGSVYEDRSAVAFYRYDWKLGLYDQALANWYYAQASAWYMSTKLDLLANNNVILGSQSHSDLHTASVWNGITQSCGLQ